MAWRVEVDDTTLRDFARLLNAEAEPKKLRRELARDLRQSLTPAVQAAKSEIQSMGHSSQARATPALRPSIARKVRAEVRLSGRTTGARVKAQKVRQVRGFENAPKLTNRKGWRRRVFGGDEWVEQRGKPGWFDDSMAAGQQRYRQAAISVLEEWARRMARKTKQR